jgi:hypothetical protein
MKLDRQIKVSLSDTYSKVREIMNLSEKFSI